MPAQKRDTQASLVRQPGAQQGRSLHHFWKYPSGTACEDLLTQVLCKIDHLFGPKFFQHWAQVLYGIIIFDKGSRTFMFG
jgi:hypothetical protein